MKLREAIEITESHSASLPKRLAEGRFLLWLGSGVSRDRFPDLRSLIKRATVAIYDQMEVGSEECDFRKALISILGMVPSSGLDPDSHPDTWPEDLANAVFNSLVTKYSEILEVPVPPAGREVQDLLDLPELYGDPSVGAAPEHRLVALLIEEGVLPEAVTTNWDPLVERAHADCRGSRECAIAVVVNAQDLTGFDVGRFAFYKIHGCAERATHEVEDRKDLVATQTDIQKWEGLPEKEPIREMLRSLTRTRSTLFVGLSGQDSNIQQEHFQAFLQGDNLFSPDEPRIVFCGPKLESSQQRILKLAYGDEYQADPAGIDASASLNIFARPFLGAAFILVLSLKAQLILNSGSTDMSPDHVSLVADALTRLGSVLEQAVDEDLSDDERWEAISSAVPGAVARFVALFRDRRLPETPCAYQALHPRNAAQMADDPNLKALGHHWMLLALAAFVSGDEKGFWRLELVDGGASQVGQFCLRDAASVRQVFIIPEETHRPELEYNLDMDFESAPDAIVVYTRGESTFRRATSPARQFPGSGRGSAAEVWLAEAASGAEDAQGLVLRFVDDLGIAGDASTT